MFFDFFNHPRLGADEVELMELEIREVFDSKVTVLDLKVEVVGVACDHIDAKFFSFKFSS